MKHSPFLFVAIALALTASPLFAAKYKVVFHLDSKAPGLYDKALSHVKNLLEDSRVKEDVDIALMANSDGAYLLVQNAEFKEKLEELERKGVHFKICKNTMKRLKIAPDTVFPFAEQVESAVGELVLLQADGYAYIQPTAP